MAENENRKRKRKSEPLSECMKFQAALAITEAANARQDERILRDVQARADAIAMQHTLMSDLSTTY